MDKIRPSLFFVILFLSLSARLFALECPERNKAIDKEMASLQEASEQFDELSSKYERSLTSALEGEPDGFLDEMKRYTAIKAKFARKRLQSKIKSERMIVANLKKSFCIECAGYATTESARTAYCSKCSDTPSCK